MKLVTAVVQPQKLTDVQIALVRHGIQGMTVSEVSGYARQHGHKEVYRGEEMTIDFVLKVRIEVLCADEDAAEIVEMIAASGRTGEIGDGKIWVTTIDQVVRMRTGERDAEAV